MGNVTLFLPKIHIIQNVHRLKISKKYIVNAEKNMQLNATKSLVNQDHPYFRTQFLYVLTYCCAYNNSFSSSRVAKKAHLSKYLRTTNVPSFCPLSKLRKMKINNFVLTRFS